MATTDGSQPDRSPIFLSEHAEKTEQPDIGKALAREVISSRILKTSILAVTATAVGIADSIDRKSGCARCERDGFVGRQIGASAWRRSVDVINSINRRHSGFAADYNGSADARRNCCGFPTCRSESSRDRSANSRSLVEGIRSLGGQGNRYTGTGRAHAARASCPCTASCPSTGCARCPGTGPACEKAPTGPVRANARAEIRPHRNPRAKVVREEQNARTQLPPVADARAQDQPVQNAQTPWLLQSFGLR